MLQCPECNSKRIDQFRTPVGPMWCGDCGFRIENKEHKPNPFHKIQENKQVTHILTYTTWREEESNMQRHEWRCMLCDRWITLNERTGQVSVLAEGNKHVNHRTTVTPESIIDNLGII